MLAVDVGVGHQHDLVIAQLGEVELVVDARAERRDDRLDLVVLEDAVDPGLLDVDDLPSDREDRLEHRVAPGLGRAARRVALDDVDLAALGVVAAAVGELAGQAAEVAGRLAPHELAGLAGREPGLRRADRLVDDGLGLGRVGLEPVAEVLVADLLDERAHLGVAELGLRLALELRLGDLHRHDRGEALADVVAGERRVLVLDELLVPRVAVDRRGQRGAEALLVGAALGGVDRVAERVDGLGVARVPLHRDLDLVAGALRLEPHRLAVDRVLGVVDVGDEVLEAARVVERALRDLRDVALGVRGLVEARAVGVGALGLALVAQVDGQALVEEGHLLQAARDRLEVVGRRLEDRRVGPEGDRRTGLAWSCPTWLSVPGTEWS